MQGLIRIATLVVIGAILGGMIRNPKGTRAFFGSVDSLWKHSLQGAGGQNIR